MIETLTLAWQSIVGILIATAVIMLAVKVLTVVFADKKKDEDENNV